MINGKITWTSERRAIKELIPAKYNPRQLTEKQTKDLSNSLTRFNLADPIVININNKIIGGHQRINILKTQGVSEVDVRVPDRELTEKEEQELNLRLNKNLGEWDFDKLANFDEDFLLDVGFDSTELDKIFQLKPDAKDDEVPDPPEEATSKLGDIFQLGRHRLMCGDSTKVEDVEKLMDGKKADMVFTDPPYGMDLDTDFSGMKGIAGGNKYFKVKNDNIDYCPSHLFRDFGYCKEMFLWGADYYAERLIDKNKGSWIVWDKAFNDPNDDYDKMFGSNFELCWSKNKHKRALARFLWKGIFGLPKEDTKKRLHPTQKPVDLIIWFLRHFGGEEQVVSDLFLGSGSTLIACEKTNRICYGMEIDPIYCDVIMKRFEDYTGQKAVKING